MDAYELIDKLAAMMAEEWEGAAKYAHCALKHKADHPKLAEMFHTMAGQEAEHAKHLHEAIAAQFKAMQDEYDEA